MDRKGVPVTFEEEKGIIADEGQNARAAWESACERARAAEQLADVNEAQCRRWLSACHAAQDELAAIKGALRYLRSFVGGL